MHTLGPVEKSNKLRFISNCRASSVANFVPFAQRRAEHSQSHPSQFSDQFGGTNQTMPYLCIIIHAVRCHDAGWRYRFQLCTRWRWWDNLAPAAFTPQYALNRGCWGPRVCLDRVVNDNSQTAYQLLRLSDVAWLGSKCWIRRDVGRRPIGHSLLEGTNKTVSWRNEENHEGLA